MNPDWIFSIALTAVNLVLCAFSFYCLRKLRRHRSRALEQAEEQWRSNLNFAQVKAIIDEANKTQGRQRQAPNATAPVFNGSQSVSKPETGLRDLPSRPLN